MPIRLKRHKGLMKTITVIIALVLFGWLYREFHPTIIFHTPTRKQVFGKDSLHGKWGFGETVYQKSHRPIQVALLLELERGRRDGCFHRQLRRCHS